MHQIVSRLAASILLLAPLAAGAMPMLTLNVDAQSGKLLGASNVRVAGGWYDVEFVDGTCVAVFSGCDDPSDFAFSDEWAAVAASQALLDQVFLDGPLGNFDSDNTLTAGCSSPYSCAAVTPYEHHYPRVLSAFAINNPPERIDRIWVNAMSPTSPTDAAPFWGTVWARWVSVPEPSTVALMGLGLAGMLCGRKRRRRQATAVKF